MDIDHEVLREPRRASAEIETRWEARLPCVPDFLAGRCSRPLFLWTWKQRYAETRDKRCFGRAAYSKLPIARIKWSEHIFAYAKLES
jgi:hypothetical protein